MLTHKRISFILKNLGGIENVESYSHKNENIDFNIKEKDHVETDNLKIIDQVSTVYYKDEENDLLTIKIRDAETRSAFIEQMNEEMKAYEEKVKEDTVINRMFNFLS